MRVLELRRSEAVSLTPRIQLASMHPLFSRAPTVSRSWHSLRSQEAPPENEQPTHLPSELLRGHGPVCEGGKDPTTLFSNIIWLLSFIVKPPPPRLPLGLGVPGAPSLEPLKSAVQNCVSPRLSITTLESSLLRSVTLLTTLVLEFLAPFPHVLSLWVYVWFCYCGLGREQNWFHLLESCALFLHKLQSSHYSFPKWTQSLMYFFRCYLSLCPQSWGQDSAVSHHLRACWKQAPLRPPPGQPRLYSCFNKILSGSCAKIGNKTRKFYNHSIFLRLGW